MQPGAPTAAGLKLQIFCKPFSRQLHNIAHLCSQISAVLSGVDDLRINVARRWGGQENSDCEIWQGLIANFLSTRNLYIAGAGDYATNVLQALQLTGRRETVLPALRKLRIQEPEPRYAPVRKEAASLITSRWLSGRLMVEYERLLIKGRGVTGSLYGILSASTTC